MGTMKRRQQPRRPETIVSFRLAARTGSHCPASGIWTTAAADEALNAWFPEGGIMPPSQGAAATWTYLPDLGSKPPAGTAITE
jgi:hypothetical protein